MTISHPEKLLFPQAGISKGELAEYYDGVAAVMVPHLRGRPVTMERFPAGIEHKGFMQKDVSKGFPPWLQRVEVPKKGGSVHYPLVDDRDALLWLANQNCVTPHVWSARHPTLDYPDLCVFDLDPSQDEPEILTKVALAVRDVLAELGLESWVKTSGSKGYHIAVPLDGRTSYDRVWHFAHGVGAWLVKRDPEHLTQEFIKADRGGRILVDTGRNGYGATFAAAYAVRARPQAPVSAPCSWAELEQRSVAPTSITLRSMARRLDERGDLWSDLHARPQSLTAPLEQLSAQLTEQDWAESHAASTRKPKARKDQSGPRSAGSKARTRREPKPDT
jgi:bifunctional non-homologous end joining protein LigD